MSISQLTSQPQVSELVSVNQLGVPVTTSLAIAEGVGNPHSSVIKLIRNNSSDLAEFGMVGFEIQPKPSGQRGGSDTEYAILNEQHATLLMTYMRNNDVVRAFKKRLVKEFFEMAKKELQQQPALPANYKEALKQLILQEEHREQLMLENQQKEHQIRDLQSFFKKGMTLPAFCKMLNGVNVMQVSKFFMEKGWLYNSGKGFRVASKARDKYLTETIAEISPHGRDAFVTHQVTLLKEGAIKVYDLYREGKLPMKKTWNGQFSHWKQEAPMPTQGGYAYVTSRIQ